MSNKRKFFPKLSKHSPWADPLQVMYSNPPKCTKCGDWLELKSVKPHWFPYTHVDLMLMCGTCLNKYTFGIPCSRSAGLALIVWDSNPLESIKKFEQLEVPRCPYKHGRMLPTKIFGDWVPNEEDVEFQWKCIKCFLTIHKAMKRDYPHLDRSPFTEEERADLEEKLKAMGYLG